MFDTYYYSPPPRLYQTNWFRGRFTSSFGDIATQPGPGSLPGLKNIPYCSTLKCLYMNSRSIGKKLNELQALSIGSDLVFCVESWLNPNYLNCELLPSSAGFTIYRRDRENRRGGGVFLAVKNRLLSIRPLRSRNGR